MSCHVTCIASCNNHVFVIMNIACCTNHHLLLPFCTLTALNIATWWDCLSLSGVAQHTVCRLKIAVHRGYWAYTLYVLNMFTLTMAVSITRFSDGMASDSVSNDSYRSFLNIRTFCNFDAFNFHRRRAVCCFQTKRSLITKVQMKERRGRRRRKTDN